MDHIGGLIERLQIDPHHIVVAHAPRQAHQQAVAWLLAPVGDQRAAEGNVQRDLQLVAAAIASASQ